MKQKDFIKILLNSNSKDLILEKRKKLENNIKNNIEAVLQNLNPKDDSLSKFYFIMDLVLKDENNIKKILNTCGYKYNEENGEYVIYKIFDNSPHKRPVCRVNLLGLKNLTRNLAQKELGF